MIDCDGKFDTLRLLQVRCCSTAAHQLHARITLNHLGSCAMQATVQLWSVSCTASVLHVVCSPAVLYCAFQTFHMQCSMQDLTLDPPVLQNPAGHRHRLYQVITSQPLAVLLTCCLQRWCTLSALQLVTGRLPPSAGKVFSSSKFCMSSRDIVNYLC